MASQASLGRVHLATPFTWPDQVGMLIQHMLDNVTGVTRMGGPPWAAAIGSYAHTPLDAA
jgi:hypothetical protein